ANPVEIDELKHACLLLQFIPSCSRSREEWAVIRGPFHGLVRQLEIFKNAFVETVASKQQILNLSEKSSGLCALNDTVVIGATDGHHLAHTHPGEGER